MFKRHFWVLLGAVALAMSAVGQTKDGSPPVNVSTELVSTIPIHFQWRDDVWNADNTPYSRLRLQIDEELAGKSSAEKRKVLSFYESKAEEAPENPIAQFSWAYAAWVIEKESGNFGSLGARIDTALTIPASPRTYDWYRIRFLIQTSVYSAPVLRPVGERLLKEDDQDYDVLFGTVRTMDVVDLDERKQVLAYLDRLITHDADVSKYHAIGGAIHFAIYLQNHNPQEKVTALREYQTALKLMSPSHPRRGTLEFWIQKVKDS